MKLRLMATCSACIATLIASGAQAQSGDHDHHPAPAFGAWGYDLAGRGDGAPGDDFFAYASGKWDADTSIPADKTSYGVFDLLYDRSQEQLKAIIEASAANPETADATLVGHFYASFMDEARVNALGAQPLQADLTKVRAIADHDAMARYMGATSGAFGGSLFSPSIFEDMRSPDANALYIQHAGLGLPNRDYYLEDNFAEARTKYRAYIAQMLTLAGWDDPEGAADRIFAFETEVAKLHWEQAARRQYDKAYNPMTLAELEAFAPGFDWAGWAQGAQVAKDGRVFIVWENTAFPGLAKLYADTPMQTLRDWQAFHTTNQAASYLSQPFVDARFDFFGKTLTGAQENRPRWKRGVGLVDGQLGEALGREYVRLHFPPESKAQMEALVANLLKAMQARIERLDWMSDETRAQALKKLSTFGVKVGYPNKWRSYDGLTIAADDLYGNVQRASAFEWAYQVDKLDKPVDPEEWGMTPQTINAYYNPPRNEIVFPAAILQPPFFDPNADPAVNYGAIGGVIGHEITHGFDDQGRKFNAEGVLQDWWTPEDSARFEERAAVLGAQYDALEPLPGVNVNGKLTMGENIADLGGLLLALDAYKMSLNGQEAPVLDGLTGEQRVFLGWAQAWREKIRDEALTQQVTTDPHSPSRIRATQSPRNIDAWYEAFGVTPQQRAYIAPESRARIW
jgi:putative endopeptidase